MQRRMHSKQLIGCIVRDACAECLAYGMWMAQRPRKGPSNFQDFWDFPQREHFSVLAGCFGLGGWVMQLDPYPHSPPLW